MLRRFSFSAAAGIILIAAGYSASASVIILTHSVTGIRIAILSPSEYTAFRLMTALSLFLCLPCSLFLRRIKDGKGGFSFFTASCFLSGSVLFFTAGVLLRLAFLNAVSKGAEVLFISSLGYPSWGITGAAIFTGLTGAAISLRK
jgi:hypothetical protein